MGFEDVLGEELATLGIFSQSVQGGVELVGGFDVIERVHLRSRIAESMRLRLKPFHARDFAALVLGFERLPWQAYLGSAKSVHVSVTCHTSRLYHSDAIRQRCLAVLANRLKRQVLSVPRKEADQTLFVRLVDNQVQVSVDASGSLLHRRGERVHVSQAPLRETVAAGLVRLLGGSERVWDPFCGSGTLLLEWHAARTGQAGGARRAFAFEEWPAYRSRRELWLAQKAAAALGVGAAASAPRVLAWGDDTDAHALLAAEHNLTQAGYLPHTELSAVDFAEMAQNIAPGTAVLSNPPYGVRLGQVRLDELYQRFDTLLQTRVDLRPAVIITGYQPYRRTSRLGWKQLLQTKNGGISAEVLRLD